MPTPADILNITKSLDKYFSDIHTSLELVTGEEYKDLHDMLEKLKNGHCSCLFLHQRKGPIFKD